MSRNTTATIHLNAIRNNYLLANSQASESETIAVIKADAYGHGAIEVAKTLEPIVPAFAVAIIEEAVQLREAGIIKPILILQGINTLQERQYADEQCLWLMISTLEQAELIIKSTDTQAGNYWIKFDSGMHRLGLTSSETKKVLNLLSDHHHDNSFVLCTHLACASDVTHSMSKRQISAFNSLVLEVKTELKTELTEKRLIKTSIANSAGLLGLSESHRSWNRPGIMLYGLTPFEQPHSATKKLQPAMSFRSTVISIRQLKQGDSVGYGCYWTAARDSVIATIAVGYADGYPRHARNNTPLLVAGQKASLVGRVSMDMITADITDCNSIKIGDSVELWGKHISVDEVAQCAETIGYDLVTAVSQRVPRSYV